MVSRCILVTLESVAAEASSPSVSVIASKGLNSRRLIVLGKPRLLKLDALPKCLLKKRS